jgi:hypothetical protein
MRKVLKVDYDTMFVFNSLIPLTGVRNILGIDNYEKCKNPEITLIGWNSEMCRIILIKNHKVVYEDEYQYRDYNTYLDYDEFTIVKGQGIFDGGAINVEGYMYTEHIFKITKTNNKRYLVEKRK